MPYHKLTGFALFILCITNPLLYSAKKVTLWHAYRGAEKTALESVADKFNLTHSDIQVSLLAVPFDAFFDKLNVTMPLGQGPDLFISGYSSAGYWSEQGMILPLESYFTPQELKEYLPYTTQAFNFMYPEALWGIPANTKCLALFYNRQNMKNPPKNMDELILAARNYTRPSAGTLGRWGFAYETGNFYYHALWLHAFGGNMFRKLGVSPSGFQVFLPQLRSKAMTDAFYFLRDKLLTSGIIPPSPNNTLITQLFNTGNALFVLNGQWFRGEISPRISYGVMPVPEIVGAPSLPLPFLTVEGYFLSSFAHDQLAAIEVIRYFSSGAMQKIMATQGKHTPTHLKAFEYSVVKEDSINQIFVSIGRTAVKLPNGPESSLAWGPFTGALGDMLSGQDPDTTQDLHQKELIKSIEDFHKSPGLFKKMEK